MKPRFIQLFLLLVAVSGLAVVVLFQVIRWAESPLRSESDHPSPRVVVIPAGWTLQQVASLLEREQLIKSRWAFVWLARVQEADRRIQPGEYELHAAMSPAEILTKLVTGRVLLHTVTIPEGLTVAQIGNLLAERNITDRAEFIRLARDKMFIQTLKIDAESLEGYLFPDTYRFARPTSAKEVIKTMVEQLDRVFSIEWRARAKELGLTMHQVLTLASVIEKETGSAEERPHISSVFHNRLKKNIPLQSDPTVIYGLPHFDGNLRKKDLTHPSPYNTYRWVGLPPGPIASPGADSIRAALYPASTPHLYFVSKNDGTHHFSTTLVQHNRAVELYQKRPFRRSGRSETSMMKREKQFSPS
ncbi:MAG: endolytic transglycosylase MltG [Nitrospira sp.]|nr:endolytic transglycosylase MltG [Nitrospira sp.]